MAGHNKWSTIKNKKGKEDAKKAKVFTKLGRALMVAAREGGGDIEYNAALNAAVEKAKAANMPNDNINRAIKKGTGEVGGAAFEEITYEGYGPEGIAVIVHCLTDNRNRTAADIRHAFDKYGGNLGTSGSVLFMFERKGVLIIDGSDLDEDQVMMDSLEVGADDFQAVEEIFEVYTSVENFDKVRKALSDKDYKFEEADIMYMPNNYQAIQSEENIKLMEKMIDILEDNDDVQDVYHNWDI